MRRLRGADEHIAGLCLHKSSAVVIGRAAALDNENLAVALVNVFTYGAAGLKGDSPPRIFSLSSLLQSADLITISLSP